MNDSKIANMFLREILVITFLLGIVLIPQFLFWGDVTDDSYISFRYAERLSEGKGLTFNDDEYVEGFSNPLWVLLMSSLHLITGISIPLLSKLLGLLSAIGTSYFIYFILKTLSNERSFLIFSFVMLLLLFSPGFHIYNSAGLEGPLLGLLLISTIFYSIQSNVKSLNVAAFLMGLAGITRPEGLLYGIIWLIFTYRFDSNIKLIVQRVIIVFTPSILYLVFRYFYFDSLLPNTAIAKPSGTYSHLFGILNNFLPLISLSATLLILLVYFYLLNKKKNIKFLVVTSGMILSNFIFILYSGGDWMLFGRFFMPVWPIIIMLFSYLLYFFLSNITNTRIELKYLYIFCLISLIFTHLILIREEWFEYSSNKNISNVMKGKDQVKVGVWLDENVKKGSTVATLRLGGISYAAPELTFYDTFGLTDRKIAMFRNRISTPYYVTKNPIIKRQPDILAVINEYGNRTITVETMIDWLDYLKNNYELINSFPQGTGVFFEIWIRKDKKDKILKNNEPYSYHLSINKTYTSL